MRPLRFLLTLLSCVVAFFLLLFVGPFNGAREDVDERGGSFGTYFNWRAPSSLFPPSAIISITDDNSTNFVARPAAFGPLLPVKSLSGQLWIGSGFGNDHLGQGGSGAGAGGELGCSDVPGWDDGSWSNTKKNSDGKSAAGESQGSNAKRAADDEDMMEAPQKEYPTEDDGTDDHLHHPLPASDGLKTNGEAAGYTKKPTHADIQSLQESAEIAGKVVLLSRGGCGFLEKVKWVQRRGGIALIVGDDIRGGPLVTMYARGDTSNVTIPSLFTSYTTAQLLSSLMPAQGSTIDDAARLGLTVGDKSKEQTSAEKDIAADKPNFTTTTGTAKATSTAQAKKPTKDRKPASKHAEVEQKPKSRCGWFASAFGACSDGHADSRRPPSSGNIGWVLQEEFEDDEKPIGKAGKQAPSSTASTKRPTTTPKPGSHDGFVIGVQDWRDPDLVAEAKEQHLKGSSTSSSSSALPRTSKAVTTSLRGGSITPGSGEYGKANHEAVDLLSPKKSQANDGMTSQQTDNQGEDASRGWLGRLFSSDPGQEDAKPDTASQKDATKAELESHHGKAPASPKKMPSKHGAPAHEGLWVTLSQTSMSSPFFDTLLVLVVSPLVTLTVVYALLLLRSRIRRRRWRAPKSVVERLPVRTYQTMASSTASTTSSASSPSATTPLLPASRPISTRSRPRARTASEVPQGGSLLSDEMASPSLEQIEEKRAAGLAEWRRRYGGKQRECVVCLEEYVDGVSRVMSLPCGHEFHAECITPWLTTRRRTCPICKGDVVRSLARHGAASSSTSPSSALQPYHDSEDEDDVQEQAANIVNDDPAAQQPVSREDEAFEDLERGLSTPASIAEPDRNR
ncbi:E3 ubiquitin-protein ligase RNF13 [Pseudocercospora fuligena]|uniref:RING-type E3 ubiquitin transferase n=1 Tax=Pseudocercospora fuligena TaxID=685502 RepID=A0A8H6RR53_9PEZI|nr:E3 ubiquitin-protein ligase RNF13 [Pseudocercospora fuligena]